MNKRLEQIIETSVKKLNNCFYKILTDENNQKYIIEYLGPTKSVSTLISEGWNNFPKEFLSDITENTPYFNFNNYKYSNELNKIVKISNDEKLQKKLNEINLLIECDDNGTLTLLLNHIKSILGLFNINFVNFDSFDDLLIKYEKEVNISSFNINEKTNYLVAMSEYKKNIEDELLKIGILNPTKFFNEKFKYFLVLI